MKYEVLLPEHHNVDSWSGGKTRELYIAGGAADYAARDFTLRLSSATVAVKNSTFTPLPGFKRALMVLDGTVRLAHDDKRPVTLSPFQVNVFDGGSATESWGCCQDFNVMWAKDAPLDIELEATAAYPCRYNGADEDFYYAYRGDFLLYTKYGEINLTEGSLIHLKKPGCTHIRQITHEPVQLVHVVVQHR